MAKETGYTGLNEWSGLIKEDPLREFHGKEAYKRFNEMRLNNSTVGSGLLAIEYVIRGLSWNFTSTEEDDPWLELVEDARAAMSGSWNDFISEVLSMLWAGYCVFEKVYQRDERNRVLWRKFAPRGQDTVYKWKFDDEGGIAGLTQMGAPTYKTIDLDIKDLILFRMRAEKNNPEGRSLLRTAWISYFYLKNYRTFQGIGFERDLNGLPVITLPQGADTNESDTNSDASKAAKIVRNLRNDEQAGLVKPFGWDFALMSGQGKSFEALQDAINDLKTELAISFFSQFLMLGQDGVGSLALSENSTDFFLQSVNAITDIISETFTSYAVRPLLKMNGATDEEAGRVKLEHTSANSVDITKIGQFLASIKDVLTFDENDELWIRQVAGMPERSVEQLKEERAETQARKQEALDAMRERMNQDNDDTDENSTFFVADAPDDDKRRQYERKWTKIMKPFLEKQRKRIIREARNAAE